MNQPRAPSSSTMLLQRSISPSPHPHLPLPSPSFCSQTLLGFNRPTFLEINRHQNVSIICAFSRVRTKRSVGDKRRRTWKRIPWNTEKETEETANSWVARKRNLKKRKPEVEEETEENRVSWKRNLKRSDGENGKKDEKNWVSLYRRISLMEDPTLGVSDILTTWEKEKRRKHTKWELERVVKELIKYRRYKLGIEVYEWMSGCRDKFRVAPRDAVIQLKLISELRGIPSAEEYFLSLPENLKDKRVYSALLSAYVNAKMRKKAESLNEEIKNIGFGLHSMPYNLMMTLYLRLEEYKKVLALISEMIKKNVALDLISYNIWITTYGALGSTRNMEKVVQEMKLGKGVSPNWITYRTMATIYIKLGQTEKAKDYLKKVESQDIGRDRTFYHYLLTLYSIVGKKEDVYRIWSKYKSSFYKIWNLGYKAMIDSLLRLDDIEEAKKIYGEWFSVKSRYDPRICNLFIWWYVKKDLLEEAEDFLEHVFEVGGRVDANTWEILARGHIEKKQISEALYCLKEALVAEGAEEWRPNPTTISGFILVCEQESGLISKKLLLEVLKQVKYSGNEAYPSLVTTSGGINFGCKLSVDSSRIDHGDNDNDDGTNMLLLEQLQESF